MANLSRPVARPSARPTRGPGGGKLSVFEVIRAAQESQADDETASRPQAATRSNAAASPVALGPFTTARHADAAPPAPSSRATLVVASVAAAVAVLCLILVVGRQFTGGDDGEATTQAESSRQLALGRPDPSVLDVAPNGLASTPAAMAVLDSAGNTAAPSLARPLVRESAALPATPVTQSVKIDSPQRTYGLNYVLIESYAASEEAQALATRDALLGHGLGATIERGIPGWKNRLCVVGTVGFEHISGNDELRDYLAKLKAVSNLYEADRRIKTFKPMPIHWSKR